MSRTRTLLILITGLLITAVLAPTGASSAGPETDSASGIVTIKEGKRCKIVDPGMNVTSATKVTATMLTAASGNSVRNVRRFAKVDEFKVCLAKTAPKKARVAWIAHNGSGLAVVTHVHRAADLVDESGLAFNTVSDSFDAPSMLTAMISTEMRVPADGLVLVEVSGHWSGFPADSTAWCQLQKGTPTTIDTSTQDPWIYLNTYADPGRWTHFSGHRVIPINAADNPNPANGGQVLSFVCDERLGGIRFDDLHISATFFATSYEPG